MLPRPRVVVVVGNHQESLAMRAIGLMAMGFHPVAADNAEDGFTRACEIHPDAIVVDLTLPEPSGLELAHRLRHDVRTQTAGIIVLISAMSVAIARSALEAGCDRLLLKPCPPDTLALEIGEVLGARLHAAMQDARRGSP